MFENPAVAQMLERELLAAHVMVQVEHAGHDVHAVSLDHPVSRPALDRPAHRTDPLRGHWIERSNIRDDVPFDTDVVGTRGRTAVPGNDHHIADHQPVVGPFGQTLEAWVWTGARLGPKTWGADWASSGATQQRPASTAAAIRLISVAARARMRTPFTSVEARPCQSSHTFDDAPAFYSADRDPQPARLVAAGWSPGLRGLAAGELDPGVAVSGPPLDTLETLVS